jgi:hypothetical protein
MDTTTPKDEIIKDLEKTAEAIASYRSYLDQGNKKNPKQVKKETDKLNSILRAIKFIRATCPESVRSA